MRNGAAQGLTFPLFVNGTFVGDESDFAPEVKSLGVDAELANAGDVYQIEFGNFEVRAR